MSFRDTEDRKRAKESGGGGQRGPKDLYRPHFEHNRNKVVTFIF